MILKKEILKKAEEWMVPSGTVDKDYVLGHFLNSFFNFGDNKKLFVFKGGTCLRKCYFNDYRFSEDLDFTLIYKSFLIDKSFFEEIAKECEVTSGIKFWVRDFENIRSRDVEKGYKCVINFWGANHNRNLTAPPKERWQSKIEIDVSFDEEILFPLNYQPIFHPYSDLDKIQCEKIATYSLEEILTEKIRSFYQRSYKAPRDFYDVWYLLNSVPFEDWSAISVVLERKCAIKNKIIDTTLFKNEAVLKSLSISWDRSIVHHFSAEKLPALQEIWNYLDENLFEKYIKVNNSSLK